MLGSWLADPVHLERLANLTVLRFASAHENTLPNHSPVQQQAYESRYRLYGWGNAALSLSERYGICVLGGKLDGPIEVDMDAQADREEMTAARAPSISRHNR
jgi:hypothetical protein